jgi:hypothetical protein
VLLGTIYLWMGQRRSSMTDITNIMGALFICITFLGTSNASGVQPIVAVERPVFYRELAAGMYSPLPFAVAQVSHNRILCGHVNAQQHRLGMSHEILSGMCTAL